MQSESITGPYHCTLFQFEIDSKGNFKESSKTPFPVQSNTWGGESICELENAMLLATYCPLQHIYVFSGSEHPRPLRIPKIVNEDSDANLHFSMTTLKNPQKSGIRELIAMTFRNEKELVLYEIGENELIQNSSFKLDFKPTRLLWIPSRESLLVSSDRTTNRIGKLTFNEGVTNEKLNIDRPVEVECWALNKNSQGIEAGVLVFDSNEKSLDLFAFY